MRAFVTAIAAACFTAAPALAQEHEVSRRTYNFFARSLTIEVLADGPGALQVLRGGRGRLEVAARARDGLAAFALGGDFRRDRLRLGALGALRSDYAVIVPEDVHVSVSLPGERVPRSVARDAAALLRWDGAAPGEPVAGGAPAPLLPGRDGYLVHSAAASPDRVELPDVAALRSVELRLAGDRFSVAASRPLGFTPGPGPLVIRTGGDALDLVITVPRGTRSFQLTGPQGVLASLADGRLRTACQPSLQLNVAERQSLTLSPASGELRCR